MKKTTTTFMEAKAKGDKLSFLTAYDYSSAKLIDSCNIDGILVGDSLGMVCLGYDNTLKVTMDDMLHHTKAVARGVKEALLISDMPFMSYQASTYDAIKNAGRLIQEGGAEAVKLEGGTNVLEQISGIVKAQIPVVGHLGLTPQSVNIFGGFKVQCTSIESARLVIEEAKRLEDAGVFAIVLECMPKEVARIISKSISIPTIGIGAGSGCDGQILVYHDIFGLYDGTKAKFIKEFANIGELTRTGIKTYIDEVTKGIYPDDAHSFKMSQTDFNQLMEELNKE
ncbi:MAG: 3-methyl-2-oxobutanoate hydroxymethyltransferase [Fusobacteria bacterium]|nr:MAG: 3-methyl-2-oxobutanoate hydroxymethyltransferase [Fusobacteriota bacterium]KAF0230170.1 MAG: 3-methyl-2-oxobutanoate [Fusobacteriota bacterium]